MEYVIILVIAIVSVQAAIVPEPCHHWSHLSCLANSCTRTCLDKTSQPTYNSLWLTSLTFASGSWGDVYCPDGYTKDLTNLNEGTGKSDYIYTCYRQGEDLTPINDIVVITGMTSDAADCPTGYVFLDFDLNNGAGGMYIYYCYSRGSDKPINSIVYKVLDEELEDPTYPNGTCRLQDLNDMAGGEYVYLCFSKDQDVIEKIVLTDVIYDLSKISENNTNLVSVASIRFNNTSDVDAEADSITNSYSYITSQFWATAMDYGIDATIIASVPVFNAGWSLEQKRAYITKTGSASVTQYRQSYTLSCNAPPRSAVECSAAYTQGQIEVPYNATQTVYYADGRTPAVSEIEDIYSGVSVSSLDIVNKVVGNFTED